MGCGPMEDSLRGVVVQKYPEGINGESNAGLKYCGP
jgi:hypothetical protein